MIELAREQLETNHTTVGKTETDISLQSWEQLAAHSANLSWGKANVCAAEEWIGGAEGGEVYSKMCDTRGKEQTAISGISTLRELDWPEVLYMCACFFDVGSLFVNSY